MNRSVAAIAVLGLILGVPSFADDVQKELDKMQGEWRALSIERDGMKLPEEQVALVRRSIKGDQFTLTRSGQVAGKGTFKLDPTKKPKAIDLTRDDAKDKPALGIYELEGDDYKICYGPPGGERPKDFNAKPGSGNTLATWKRDKK